MRKLTIAPEQQLDAGDFDAWLDATLDADKRDDGASDVPCGTCNACCRASQYIHIAADEHEALARIPAAALIAVPGLPVGERLMRFDDHGCCPMLQDDRCSIYDVRPQTCRVYDCRVFSATDTALAPNPPIRDQTLRWRFSYADDAAKARHDAVRAAMRFTQEHQAAFDVGVLPTNPTQLAQSALRAHALFLREDDATVAERVKQITTLLGR